MATIYFQSQSNARLALATQYYKTQANPTCRYVSYHQTQALCSDTGLLFFKTHANPGGFSQPVYYVTHASAPSQAQQTLWNGLISGTSLPEWEGVFKIGETEAPCYIDFKVNWNLSSPSTASMSFNDPYCRYMPEFPGEFHEKMNEYALNASYSPNNPLTASIKYGDRIFQYNFLGIGFDFSREWITKMPSFQWRLIDHSLKWQADYQSEPTVRSTRISKRTNLQELQELGSRYNVNVDLSATQSYVIPLQNRQGSRPMDWVGELLEGLKEDYIFKNGDTFYPFYPARGEGYKDVVDYSLHTLEESVSGSWTGVYNHVVVSRAVEVSAHQDSEETSVGGTTDVDNFGEYTYTFSEEVFNPQWKPEVEIQGIFSDYLLKNADGKVVRIAEARAPNRVIYGAGFQDGGPTSGIKSVTFTWGNRGTNPITGDKGRIRFWGTPIPSKKDWGGTQLPTTDEGTATNPVPALRSEAQDAASQAMFGIKRLEVSANPIIPTKEQGDLVAARILAERAWNSRQVNVKIRLRPSLLPGMIILEKVQQAGPDYPAYTRRVLLTSCEHSFSKDPANCYTNYSGVILHV